MKILEPGGRCGIVLDEGLLYRTNEEAFVKTKRSCSTNATVVHRQPARRRLHGSGAA